MKKISSNPYLRFILFIIVIVILILINQKLSINIKKIETFLKLIPPSAAITIFLFLYVVGTFFIWYLKDPLKLIGAIFFGAYLSTLLIYIAETINALIFFTLSNLLGKDFVDRSLTGSFKNIYEKLGRIHLGWVFLLRVLPIIPFRILDISFGLSKLSLQKYIAVVILASPPRIFFTQFVLAAVKGVSLEAMTIYVMKNPVIVAIAFLYIIISCIAAFAIKRKVM